MRSISAKVTADVSVFKRAMETGGQYVKGFGRKVKETSKEASADLAAIDATAAKLADQIQSTSKAVDDLGRAFAKTGDAVLLKQRDQQQKMLADLKKAQALVFDVRRSEDDGGKAGRAYGAAVKDALMSAGDIFSSTVGMVGKALPPEVKAALLAGALSAAPFIGAALAGAITGAAGGVGIAGGIALALRDPKIKAEAGQTGRDIIAQLTSDASEFGPALVQSLQILRSEFHELDDEFESIFANSAEFLGPLTEAAGHALGEIVTGLDQLIDGAGPVMEVIGNGIAGLGDAVGDIFTDLSDNGVDAAVALDQAFRTLEGTIRAIGATIEGLTAAYGWLAKHGAFGREAALEYLRLEANANIAAEATDGAAGSMDRARGSAEGLAGAVQSVEHEFVSLADAVNASVDVNLTAAESALRLREAQASAAKAADKKASVSIEEEKALLALARASNAATEAADAEGRTAEEAAAAHAKQRKQLISAAMAMGHSAERAEELANQLLNIPKNTNPKVNLKINGQAQLNAIREAIAMLPGRKDVVVAIRVTGNTNVQSVRSALDKQSRGAFQRRGGVMTAMADGGTLDAGIYSASNPPLVKFAEPETGGELYLPRRGDRSRGRQLVTEAASWYGMTAVPMRDGGIAMATGGYVNVAPSTSAPAPVRRGSKLDTAAAYIDARNAVVSLNKALKENGKSFSMSTAKGRENRSMLISGIKAAQDAAVAKYEETGSVKAANAVYDEYIKRLEKTVKGQKASTATLKALAKRPVYDVPTAEPKAPTNSSGNIAFARSQMDLVEATDKARGFFDPSWGKPTFGAGSAFGRDNLNALFDFLGAAEAAAQAKYKQTGNAKAATTLYSASLAQLRGMLGAAGMSKKEIDALLSQYGRITLGNRYGGVYEHMAGGGLRTAHIAAGGPTRYAYAEAATGGELFAPKNGNLAKTRQEVGWAVQNWWGGQVAWGAGPGQRPGSMSGSLTLRVVVQDGEVRGLVRVEVDEQLGALADATVYATTA